MPRIEIAASFPKHEVRLVVLTDWQLFDTDNVLDRLRSESDGTGDAEPEVTRQQRDRDVARQALAAHGAPRDVLARQPQRQPEQRQREQRLAPVLAVGATGQAGDAGDEPGPEDTL